MTMQDPIFDEVNKRLLTTGRDGRQAFGEAMIFSAFYRTLAKRTGQSLPGFLERYPIPVFRSHLAPPTEEQIEKTSTFKKWAGTSSEVLKGAEINEASVASKAGQGPLVLRLYHGSTHTFDHFRAAARGGLEGRMGRTNYFSSSLTDANDNYAGIGPDLRMRIEEDAEELRNQHPELTQEEATERATQALTGPGRRIYHVYVRTDRPYLISEAADVEIRPDRVRIHSEARKNILASGIGESDPDYDAAVSAEFERLIDSEPHRLEDALRAVARKYRFSPERILDGLSGCPNVISGSLLRASLIDALTIEQPVEPVLRRYAPNEVFAQIVLHMGYDSIVEFDMDEKLDMGLEPGTAHICVFDEYSHNIKSVTNTGSFSPKTSNIYYQRAFMGARDVIRKFDADHVAPSEAAAHHGWGFHFHGDRKQADAHRKYLACRKPELEINGELAWGDILAFSLNRLVSETEKTSLTRDDLIAFMESRLADYSGREDPYSRNAGAELRRGIARLKAARNVRIEWDGSKGFVVQADLPEDDILLNFDAPLHHQSDKVKASLRSLVRENTAAATVLARLEGTASGKELYQGLQAELGDARSVSELLDGCGIAGHRWLERISPDKHEGPANFTVYSDRHLAVIPSHGAMAELRGIAPARLLDAVTRREFDNDHFSGDGAWGLCNAIRQELTRHGVESAAVISSAGGEPGVRVGEIIISASGIGYASEEYKELPGFREGAISKGITASEYAYDTVLANKLIRDGAPLRPTAARAAVEFHDRDAFITLFEGADASTVIHESAHMFLSVLEDLERHEAGSGFGTEQMKLVNRWWRDNSVDIARLASGYAEREIRPADIDAVISGRVNQKSPVFSAVREACHEYFATGFEKYLATEKAPSGYLSQVFDNAKRWLKRIYLSISGLGADLNRDINKVFSRILDEEAASPASIDAAHSRDRLSP